MPAEVVAMIYCKRCGQGYVAGPHDCPFLAEQQRITEALRQLRDTIETATRKAVLDILRIQDEIAVNEAARVETVAEILHGTATTNGQQDTDGADGAS